MQDLAARGLQIASVIVNAHAARHTGKRLCTRTCLHPHPHPHLPGTAAADPPTHLAHRVIMILTHTANPRSHTAPHLAPAAGPAAAGAPWRGARPPRLSMHHPLTDTAVIHMRPHLRRAAGPAAAGAPWRGARPPRRVPPCAAARACRLRAPPPSRSSQCSPRAGLWGHSKGSDASATRRRPACDAFYDIITGSDYGS